MRLSMDTCGVSMAWGQVNSLVKRFVRGDWGYVWCLVIVVVFMGLGGAEPILMRRVERK